MVTCKALKGNYKCVTKVGECEIKSDAPVSKGGGNDGILPVEILESSYASCLNIISRVLCDKMRIPSGSVSVKVKLILSDDKTLFTYHVDFGADVSEGQRKTLMNNLKNCPVRQALSKPIEFEWNEDL